MRKVILILSTIFLCCLTPLLAENNMSIPTNLTVPISSYKALSQLPKEYLPESAIKNGDVTLVQLFNYNVDILDNFVENYNKNTLNLNEMIRITRYTIEGAPIITDLTFSNNRLTLKEDSSRDFYFTPEDLVVKEYEIKRIYTTIIKNTIFYMIETTSGEKLPIAELSIS